MMSLPSPESFQIVKKIKATLLLFGLIVSLPEAPAAMLVQYQYSSGSLAPTTVDSDFTAGNTTRSGFTLPGTYTTNWIYAQGDQTPASLSATAYFSFTLTPDPGITYNLSSLTFDSAYYTTSGVTSGTTNYDFRSSLDSYTTNIGSGFHSLTGQGPTSNPTFTARSVDLSGASFQGLTGAVTFRVYIFDSITGNTRLTAIDNLTLNGVTVVPEPSAGLLVLAGGVLCFLQYRSRARAA